MCCSCSPPHSSVCTNQIYTNIGRLFTYRLYYHQQPEINVLINIITLCNIVLLRDVFHIGLVIGPRPAVLAWGASEGQYINRGPITRPIWRTSRNDTFINQPVQYLSELFLAIVETSRRFRSSCYWTDWNRANTENIRIGLVFAVLAQWKFLYCIDRFDHIKANK